MDGSKAKQMTVAKTTQDDMLVHYKDYGLKQPIVSDCEMVRVRIPGEGNVKLNATALMKLLKELIGKDLSKFALPVWINEPTSILQRSGEFMYFNHFLTEASHQESSTKRMLFVAARMVCSQFVIPDRTGKPFNPLLGETYELLTPDFRYFSEMVSHHPPIFACSCEGEGYEYRRCSETVQQFTGKLVKAYDKNMATIDLYVATGAGKKETMAETYRFKEPNIICGNIFMGSRYVEPQGQGVIQCEQTGDIAEVNFKTRGWTKSAKDENFVQVVVKNGMGKACYSIEGKYTEKLIATDLQSGEQWVLFNAPQKPEDHARMYNMNLFALQLNVLSDDLRKLLPPTDCRLRGDIQHWDQADLQAAEQEKKRLEVNQRQRRAKVKELLEGDPEKQKHWDVHDERTFYKPQFFDKITSVDGKGHHTYWYEPKMAHKDASGPANAPQGSSAFKDYAYWNQRCQRKWDAPHIYDDNCEPFY